MSLRKPALILLAGLALGVVFDRIFHNGWLGINAPVFVALIVAALAACWRQERAAYGMAADEQAAHKRTASEWDALVRANAWVLAPLLFFAAMIAVRANEFLIFLNLCAVLMLLSLIAVYMLRLPIARAGIIGYALAPLFASLMALLRGAQTVRYVTVQGAKGLQSSRRRSWAPVLRGILLASPVVLVFGALLASADLVFAELLGRLLPTDLADFLRRAFTHGSIVLVVGFFLAGGLAYTLWRDERPVESGPSAIHLGLRPFLGFTESAIVMLAVNTLFLAFVVIQVPYLFGGQLNIGQEGFTYAEYARRGFGELVGVSVLVLGLLLTLGAVTRREEPRQAQLFNMLSTVMVALTVVLLVSAFKRLSLYEMAYGFTRMRLYPHVFMVWLGLLLGWFVITLWLRPGRFAIGLLVATIGFLATLNVLNPDAFIVRQNVQRFEQLGSAAFSPEGDYSDPNIDADYLTTLSADAIPTLVQSEDRLPATARRQVAEYLDREYADLGNNTAWATWPAFHVSKWQAYRALMQRFDTHVMLHWGELTGRLETQGKSMPAIDSLIAATALSGELCLVTRNEADLRAAEVILLNPWG